MTVRRAVHDPTLRARVIDVRPLHYAAGADAALDRPAHVRAGSALARVGSRLVVVQDDASFFAVWDGAVVDSVALPSDGGQRSFDDARGNKAAKLDLEAAFALPDGTVFALGSGSTRARERIAVLEPNGSAQLFAAPAFYEALRADAAFAGSELNLEGIALFEGGLVLFQRGNGAPRGELLPRDATARVSLDGWRAFVAGGPVPPIEDVVEWDLGSIDGVRLTFTDGVGAFGTLHYLAAAEASPDAVADGPVAGVALGVLGETPRYAIVEDERGRFLGKAEGLAFDPSDRRRAYLVIDRDDPERAAELCTVQLEGPW